jgi:hypothetical protein
MNVRSGKQIATLDTLIGTSIRPQRSTSDTCNTCPFAAGELERKLWARLWGLEMLSRVLLGDLPRAFGLT